jgi:hypothetical protein
MRIFSAVILLALAALVFKTCEAFDLKGVEVGKAATRAQLQAAFGARCDFGDACLTEIAGVTVKVYTWKDKAGRVSSISASFDSIQFATIEKAAREKFGTPSSTEEAPMQNGFGAQFMARGLWWTNADGARVQLLKSFTDATLSIESAATAAANAARKTKSKM